MRAITLNVYGSPSGILIDPDASIKILRRHFPEAEIHPGDQLALRAQRAHEQGSASEIVRKLWKDAQATGPAHMFTIPLGQGAAPIKGVIKRHLADFLWDGEIHPDVRDKIIRFLRELLPDDVPARAYEVQEGNKRTPIEWGA